MNKLYVLLLPLCHALQMHQARAVGACYILSARGHVAFQLVDAHLCRHLWLLHREHTAESAALVNALRLADGYAFYERQQVLELRIFRDIALAG